MNENETQIIISIVSLVATTFVGWLAWLAKNFAKSADRAVNGRRDEEPKLIDMVEDNTKSHAKLRKELQALSKKVDQLHEWHHRAEERLEQIEMERLKKLEDEEEKATEARREAGESRCPDKNLAHND